MNWQKSTFSEDQANCIELTTSQRGIHIRESDAPGTIVTTDRAHLAALLHAIKYGAAPTASRAAADPRSAASNTQPAHSAQR